MLNLKHKITCAREECNKMYSLEMGRLRDFISKDFFTNLYNEESAFVLQNFYPFSARTNKKKMARIYSCHVTEQIKLYFYFFFKGT